MELYGKERRAIEHLEAFRAIGIMHGDALRERLRLIPNGWRDYQLLRSLSRRLTDQLYKTLPRKDKERLDKVLHSSEIVIRPQGPAQS